MWKIFSPYDTVQWHFLLCCVHRAAHRRHHRYVRDCSVLLPRTQRRSHRFPAVLIGQLGPVLGLVQFKFKSWTRLVANMLFVLGGSLMLIGIDQLVRSVFVDVYLTGLVVVWILTRVMISQWDHYGICLRCGFSCSAERKVGVLASSTQPVQSADDE